MSQAIQNRHTFNYLDNLLTKERIDTLDTFFLELDVATYVIEGAIKKGLARGGYHTLRALAMGVQMVAFAIFTVIKYACLAVYYTAKFCKDAMVALFVTMPLVVQKRFFPTAADIFEKRVEASKQAIKQGDFSKEHIVGTEASKHSYQEQKALMLSLLIHPINQSKDRVEWRKFCSLMLEIAEGDFTPSELEEKEEEAKLFIGWRKKDLPIRNLELLCHTFIEAFKSEREYEDQLTTTKIEQDPTLLLKYPHLLTRDDVQAIIFKAPKNVQERLLLKKAAILHSALQHAHQKELELVSSFSQLLPHIDRDQLQSTYTSKQEKLFIKNRLALLEQRISELEGANKHAGFEYYLLKIEHFHLTEQKAQLEKTKKAIATLKREKQKTRDLNRIHAKTAELICEAIQTRIDKTSASDSLKNCAHYSEISTRKGILEKECTEFLKLETVEEKIQALPSLMTKLHALEIMMAKKAQGKDADLIAIQESLKTYDNASRHIHLAHEEVGVWQAFNELTTPSQRDEIRLHDLANAVTCMLLETKTACQIPLLLAKKDVRSTLEMYTKKEAKAMRKGAYKYIVKASQEFIDSMQTKYREEVKKHLFSVTEFVSEVQAEKSSLKVIDENEKLKQAEKKETLDFRKIGLNLQVTDHLTTWYAKLQEIWIDHIPQEQEELLLAISNRKQQKLKMAECFDSWFVEMTGHKLGVDLSFNHLVVPDHSQKRKEALEVLKQHASTLTAQIKNAHPKKAQLSIKKQLGLDPKLIRAEQVDVELTRARLPHHYLAQGDLEAQTFHNILDELTQMRKNMPVVVAGQEHVWNAHWVEHLNEYVEQNNCQSLRLYLRAECKQVIKTYYDKNIAVPIKVQRVLYKEYITNEGWEPRFNFENIHNHERGDFLAHFLMASFSSRKREALSLEDHSRLKQICSLSSLTKNQIQEILALVDTKESIVKSFFGHSIANISSALQASPIGLEGIDAEIVRQSFKESTLPDSQQTRLLLDSYMSLGTDALSLHLIPQVHARYEDDLNHHQGREAIARALVHAHAHYPEKTTQYLLQKIADNGEDISIDERTLAPSLYLFYCEILRQVDPKTFFSDNKRVEKFREYNLSLLQEANATHLLMGLSRMIADLSYQIHYYADTGQNFEALILEQITYKIAYQSIKKNYFDGKLAISGFLKISSDLAESAMIFIDSQVQTYLDNPAHEAAVSHALKELKSADTNLFEQTVRQELGGIRQDPVFQKTELPGFFNLSVGVTLDTLTGIIYNGGQQKINLPAHLQNHPTVRTLKIHQFPFLWEPATQSFVYYIQDEKGHSQPYLIVKESDRKPVIYKKMPTSFSEQNNQFAFLQFVPRENIQLPISVMHRMGIEQFWEEANQFYGYDKNGRLVAILNQSSVTTSTEKYFFLLEEQKQNVKNIPVLDLLANNFSLNEVLVDSTLSKFYVPAVELTLEEKTLTSHQQVWVCTFKGVSEKILIAPPKGSAILSMKNVVDAHKLKGMQKNIKAAIYRKELSHTEDTSLEAQHHNTQLEAAIVKQKMQQLFLEQPQFMTTCLDDAYQSEDIEKIVELIPADRGLRESFEKTIVDQVYYPYQIFPKALKFLRDYIEQVNKLGGVSQKALAPFLQAYLTIQTSYASVCDKPLEPVFFDQSIDGSALTKDLTSALTVVINQLIENETAESPSSSLFLMQELAKFPIHKPLTNSQESLLKRIVERLQKTDTPDLALMAYLKFMHYMHFLAQIKDLAVVPLSDKQQSTSALQAAEECRTECERIIQELENTYDEENPIPNDLCILWKKTDIRRDHPLLEQIESRDSKIEKSVNEALATEMQILASKNLLQRLSSEDSIEAVPKSTKHLSEHQKELSQSFKATSKAQVSGFYFEKMGYFSEEELFNEFRLNAKGSALYGLRESDLRDIFKFLKEEKLIVAVADIKNYYRVASAEGLETHFPLYKLRALLTRFEINQQDLKRAIERTQAFLFRAMQSGFEFSFKEDTQEIDRKLQAEKQIHLQKYLQAEAILNAELPKFNATLTDLKYAYLTGDYSQFLASTEDNHKQIGRLCNALTRYLVHKTELHHIENVQKAPAKGERNKIQLLQTKRNYSVDLLLHENVPEDQRKEQIMQRAYLTFEEDYGHRCNLMQIRMFRALMMGNKSLEGIDAIQARMGFGKTALLPLLAIVQVALQKTKPLPDRHLVRYIVPAAVIEDNTTLFNERISSILGRNVVQDQDFTRYQIDKENPQASFDLIITDLKARLHFYEESKNHGTVLIQRPEIRSSMEAQDLDFAEIIRIECYDPATIERCIQAKQLLVKIRSIPTYTVFDELDDTQDFKSREVNFTRGEKVPIPITTIRPLERIVTYIEENKGKNWLDKKERAKEMVTNLCTNRNGEKITACPEALLDYLSDANIPINDETKEFLSLDFVATINTSDPKQTENDALFFLIRMVLQDEYILSLVRNKQPSTHFGIRFSIEGTGERRYSWDPDTQSALLISVPYDGVNTPKGLSVFDNREVAAITTLRYYFSSETSFSITPHLDFLIAQIQADSLPNELVTHYLTGDKGQEHLSALRKMARMLDLYELKQAKEDFFAKYMCNPAPEFRKFFGMAVVATQIRSDEGSAKSDRYEQGSPRDISLGCSGTVGDTASTFTKQAPDPAADGMLSLEIMGRENNSVIEWLTPPSPNQDYLPQIIQTLLEHTKPNTRAIADIAGICKSRDGTPETVVKELWRQLKARPEFASIEGIIYYGKDNIKRLYRGKEKAIICTTEMEQAAIRENRQYFSFYKQKNCRGSDIKQQQGAHLLVTLDENVTNSDAKQTILRFRNIVTEDSGQTFSFAAMPEFQLIVREELKGAYARKFNQIVAKLEELQTRITATITALKVDKSNAQFHVELRSLREEQKTLCDKQTPFLEKITSVAAVKLEAKHIAYFLRIQEKNAEEENALTLFRKEMKAHIKVAAAHLEADIVSSLPDPMPQELAHAYRDFLRARNDLSPFIEGSLNSLFEKYGQSALQMDRKAFIQEQQAKTLKALDTLFEIAEAFANANGYALSADKNLYKKRINKSIKAFKQRFDKHKKVLVTGTQSDGQSVAQAQAQAQAEAQAEACTETITQTLLETQERIWSPHLTLSKKPKELVSLDFLTAPLALKQTQGILGLEESIKPQFRNLCRISPAIEKKKELSHFVLLNAQDQVYIFISQEEAEAFKQNQECLHAQGNLYNSPLHIYTLIDMRSSGVSLDAVPINIPKTLLNKQFPCVALQDNGVPKDFAKLKTKDLRSLELTNVESDQLLPHLTLQFSKEVKGFFRPAEFGLSKKMSYQMSLNSKPEKDTLKLTVALPSGESVTVSMPTNNKYLNGVMAEFYGDPVVAKLSKIQARIQRDLDARFPKLEELQRKRQELDALNKKNQDIITGVSEFNLSYTMQAGLRERDSDYKGLNMDKEEQSTIGQEAITMCEDIQKLQQQLKHDLSVDTLHKLQTKFNHFVSPDLLSKFQNTSFNYLTQPLFSKEEWKEKTKFMKSETLHNKQYGQVSMVERIYGRIVHSVHRSNVQNARTCYKLDCQQTFASMIPDILKVVPKLHAAVKAIEENEAERQKIEKKIKKLIKEAGPLYEALECVKKLLEDQSSIEKMLTQAGLHHSSGRFFDQFDFAHMINWLNIQSTIAIHTELPDYLKTVEEMGTYEHVFRGLTSQEQITRTKNQDFCSHVKSLSSHVEKRDTEIIQV